MLTLSITKEDEYPAGSRFITSSTIICFTSFELSDTWRSTKNTNKELTIDKTKITIVFRLLSRARHKGVEYFTFKGSDSLITGFVWTDPISP